MSTAHETDWSPSRVARAAELLAHLAEKFGYEPEIVVY